MASTQRPDRHTRHRRLEARGRAGETWRGGQGLISALAHRAAGTERPCPGTRCRGSLRCSDPRPDGSTQHRGSSTRLGAFVARAACGLFGQRSAGFGQVAVPSTLRCQGASPSATRPPSLPAGPALSGTRGRETRAPSLPPAGVAPAGGGQCVVLNVFSIPSFYQLCKSTCLLYPALRCLAN
jgi:hypothetical protein